MIRTKLNLEKEPLKNDFRFEITFNSINPQTKEQELMFTAILSGTSSKIIYPKE